MPHLSRFRWLLTFSWLHKDGDKCCCLIYESQATFLIILEVQAPRSGSFGWKGVTISKPSVLSSKDFELVSFHVLLAWLFWEWHGVQHRWALLISTPTWWETLEQSCVMWSTWALKKASSQGNSGNCPSAPHLHESTVLCQRPWHKPQFLKRFSFALENKI
jgi:hypothetical protein